MSFLIFEDATKPTDKTKRWTIRNARNHDPLGFIHWFGAWRKYCFFPLEGCAFDAKCLEEIVDFIAFIPIAWGLPGQKKGEKENG